MQQATATVGKAIREKVGRALDERLREKAAGTVGEAKEAATGHG